LIASFRVLHDFNSGSSSTNIKTPEKKKDRPKAVQIKEEADKAASVDAHDARLELQNLGNLAGVVEALHGKQRVDDFRLRFAEHLLEVIA